MNCPICKSEVEYKKVNKDGKTIHAAICRTCLYVVVSETEINEDVHLVIATDLLAECL